MARRLFSTARRFLTLMGIFSHVAAGGCKARAVFRPRRLLIPPGMIRPQSLNQKLLFKIERNKSQIRGQIDACGLQALALPCLGGRVVDFENTQDINEASLPISDALKRT